MNFAIPWLLFLLIPVWLLGGFWWLLLWRRWRKFDRLFDAPERRLFAPPVPRWRLIPQFLGLLAALSLCVVALARPRWGASPTLAVRSQHDLVILLDVSRSMLARDVRPNRLERAKTMGQDVINAAGDDRIALVAFRNGARHICPLTRDRRFLLQSLDGMDIHSAPRGPTDLGQAIRMAQTSFDSEPDRLRTVLLISDGENLTADLDEALAALQADKIVFLTVGIGTPDGAPIPVNDRSNAYQMHEGERVITRLVHDTLQRIALATSGAYLPLGDSTADLAAFYLDHRPGTGARMEIVTAAHDQQTEKFQWLLLPAVFLLLCLAALSRGRPIDGAGRPSSATGAGRSSSNADQAPVHPQGRSRGIALMSLMILSAGTAISRPVPLRQAMQQYQREEYQTAAEEFDAALKHATRPSQRAVLLFNAGCAWYRAGYYETAVNRFQDVLILQYDPGAQHNLAAAHQQAVAEILPSVADLEEISALRRRLEQTASDLQQVMRENPEKQAWRGTYDAIDQTLLRIRRMESELRFQQDFGDQSPSDLVNRIYKGQTVIERNYQSAESDPLPNRLQQYRILADRQRTLAGMTATLESILVAHPDGESSISRSARIRDKMQSAANAIEDADEHAGATIRQVTELVYDLWSDLADIRDASERDDPAREPEETEPTENGEEEPPTEPPAAPRPEAADAPRVFPDLTDIDDPAPGVELDPAQIEILLDRVMRREYDHLDERRRRTIQHPTAGRDW